MIVIEGELGQDDYTGGVKMSATALYTIAQARTRFAKHVSLMMTAFDQSLIPAIQTVLKAYPGQTLVQIHYSNTLAQAAMTLSTEWCVAPEDALLAQLVELLGAGRVELCY